MYPLQMDVSVAQQFLVLVPVLLLQVDRSPFVLRASNTFSACWCKQLGLQIGIVDWSLPRKDGKLEC